MKTPLDTLATRIEKRISLLYENYLEEEQKTEWFKSSIKQLHFCLTEIEALKSLTGESAQNKS